MIITIPPDYWHIRILEVNPSTLICVVGFCMILHIYLVYCFDIALLRLRRTQSQRD